MRVLLAAAMLTAPAQAPSQAPATPPSFELSRPAAAPSASPEIIGGQVAIVSNWPATFVFTGMPGKPCTATAVGPRTILTAAHCLEGVMTGAIKGSGAHLKCEAHPAPVQSDIALCVSSQTISIAHGEAYESLDIGTVPPASERLVLLGYGCTRSGGSAGVLYEGTSEVVRADVSLYFYTQGGAAVCAGDSGGGAYRMNGSLRAITGVASATFGAEALKSRFAALGSPVAAKFVRDWLTRQTDPVTGAPIDIRICGINGSTLLCRG